MLRLGENIGIRSSQKKINRKYCKMSICTDGQTKYYIFTMVAMFVAVKEKFVEGML